MATIVNKTIKASSRTLQDIPNCYCRNIEAFRQSLRPELFAPGSVMLSDIFFVSMCKSILSWASTFINFVLRIIFVCAQKQMVRTDAFWIIALMTHTQSRRNRSIMKFPRVSMCLHSLPVSSPINIKSPVSVAGNSAVKFPASISFYNLRPERARITTTQSQSTFTRIQRSAVNTLSHFTVLQKS